MISTRGFALCSASARGSRGLLAAALLMAVLWGAAPSRAEEPDAPSPPEATAPAPRLRVRIQGSRALGDQALRKAAADELRDLEEKGYRPADADDAAFQMELAYRNRGYPFASVAFRVEKTPRGAEVTFTVEEGPQVRLRSVRIEGAQAVPASELQRFFQGRSPGWLTPGGPPFVEAELRSAVAEIRSFYAGLGYLDAQVDGPEIRFSADRSEAEAVVRIREGVRYRIAAVRFSGDVLDEARRELDALAGSLEDQAFFPRRKMTLRSRVLEIYGELGRPDAQVAAGADPGPEPGDVILTAEIDAGPAVTVSGVAVSGNVKTRGKFLLNRLRLRPGDRYALSKERETFRELYRTGLFSSVETGLAPGEAPDRRILEVRVEEAPSQELYVEPGWGSYERLRAKAGYREKNLFGTGRILGLEGAVSLKAQGITARFTDPWFLRTRIAADVPVFFRRREEPSFTRRELGASFLFTRRLGRRLSAGLAYQFRRTDLIQVDVDPDGAGADLGADYNLASLKAQLTYDARDDLFFPTRGHRWVLSLERADTALGGTLTFTRAGFAVRAFAPVTPSTVLGARWDTGLVLPGRNQPDIPLGERFFNGGENTVRSFEEAELGPRDPSGDPTGGLGFNVAGVELRQRLFGRLVGTVFADYGNVAPNRFPAGGGRRSRSELVSDTLDDFFRDFRPAVGFGLQYLLPVGPARLDFAWNPDRRRGEEGFVWHFSVGTAF
ncbi:MAG: outer membrane protein assembly factor BamA [Deferrisomatales bacterium]